MPPPVLTTERLLLRPFGIPDAPVVQRLAGVREVAATTLSIPHPYPDGAAEAWIRTHDDEFAAGRGVTWAITLPGSGELVGAVGLSLVTEMNRGELGYWIAAGAWGKGYATEAARAALDFGFSSLELDRVIARHFTTNPASGTVMRKLGMIREGTLRRDILKWGARHDVDVYGILREEWRR